MADQLTHRQHARAVLALGLPLVGSHLAQFAIHMTDTIMLGWHSVDELAAVVLAGAYWFTIFIFGAGFGIALMPIVASAVTSGDEIEVRRTTRMALWLSVLFGVLVLPLILLAEPILLSIGQNPTIAELSGTYLKIAGWSIFPALGVMVIKSFLAALERTQVVLWTTVAAVGLNAVINYVLIFGHWGAPEMGLRGAAYASISVNLFTFVLLCFYAAWAEPQHGLFKRLWRPDWAGFSRVFRLGLPIGLTNLAEIGLFSAAAILMGWLGTNELAAHGIAIQIASATFMVHLGLSNAATIRAGQAFGKRDEAALRRGGLVAIGISGLFALATMIVFFAFPEQLTGLFVDPADPRRPDIIPVAATLLLFAAFFQLADGGQVMILGLLRGVQDTKVPMYMAAFSYWLVAMPASYVLGFIFGFGANGVWGGLVIGLAVAAVLMGVRFWGRSVRIGEV
ncbi:MAG: MATE family efflux transporter [Marinosulfonomonas sp.]|nr:MATE family efflux transporter [Marinosulfonomonas sp.]